MEPVLATLPPVTLGMVGLSFALWANGLYLLGVDAKPQVVDGHVAGPPPIKAVAVTGSLIGAVTLLFMSLFLVVAAPLGTDPEAVRLQTLFSAVSGMYGLQFVGMTIVQAKDWDMRIVGNITLLGVPLQLLLCIVLASYQDDVGLSTADLLLQEAVLLSYAVLGAAIWAATHGKISPKVTGVCAMVALGLTWYFLFFSGGLITPP